MVSHWLVHPQRRPKRSKKRRNGNARRRQTTTSKPQNYYDYNDYEDYVDQESPKQDDSSASTLDILVSVLNFFGFLNDNTLDRADALTVPAEMTMIAVGLYGLYFATAAWDLSNKRRRKRSATGKWFHLQNEKNRSNHIFHCRSVEWFYG